VAYCSYVLECTHLEIAEETCYYSQRVLLQRYLQTMFLKLILWIDAFLVLFVLPVHSIVLILLLCHKELVLAPPHCPILFLTLYASVWAVQKMKRRLLCVLRS
jgi:hypothetical protein